MPKRPRRGSLAIYRLSVRVTREERRALRALARANHLTISALIADALAELATDSGTPPPLVTRCARCGRCPTHPRARVDTTGSDGQPHPTRRQDGHAQAVFDFTREA